MPRRTAQPLQEGCPTCEGRDPAPGEQYVACMFCVSGTVAPSQTTGPGKVVALDSKRPSAPPRTRSA